MAERVAVREISNEEGRKLLSIVRRGSGSVVRWRRAQIVRWSAQHMDVPAIAKIAFTSEDRVRDVIHNRRRARQLQPPSVDEDRRPGRRVGEGQQRRARLHSASWLNRIEAQFTALRHFCLDGTDHESHEAQAFLIRRYIAWRNRHAQDRILREVVKRANVA